MSAPVDVRQLTASEIAEAVAKRVARVGDFDDNVDAAFARHGIELDDDGFTITRGGKTFHVTVTDSAPSPAEPSATFCDWGPRRPLIDAASAIHRTQRPDPQDVAAQVARIVTHCTVDGAPEWAEQAAAKLPPEILPRLATGARALVSVLARTCLCEGGDACRQSGCPACAELDPWSACRSGAARPAGW